MGKEKAPKKTRGEEKQEAARDAEVEEEAKTKGGATDKEEVEKTWTKILLTWKGSPPYLSSRAIAPAAAAPCSSAVLSFPYHKSKQSHNGIMFLVFFQKEVGWKAWRGGGTPYNGLYGDALPKKGTFFRLSVYKRVGISLAEVYKRVGKLVI